MNNINYSSFWLDENSFLNDDILDYSIYLANVKKSISNFVFILTGKNIPVEYNTKKQSYTTGNKIYISAEKNTKKFDILVGLSLHEASHILYSDFDLLKNISSSDCYFELYKKYKNNISSIKLKYLIKLVLNSVEDRYIDNKIYNDFPGYRGYYLKLYDEYFYNNEINKILKTRKFKNTIDDYIFMLINITNSNCNLDSLPNFKKIYNLLDIKNINRLTTPSCRLNLAGKILSIILDNVFEKNIKINLPNHKIINKKQNNLDLNNDNEECCNNDSVSDDTNSVSDDTDSVSDDNDNVSNYDADDNDVNDDNLNLSNKFNKILKKQSDFVNGNVKKKIINSKIYNSIKLIEESKISCEYVSYNNNKVKCIVVKNFNKKILESDQFPYKNITDDISDYKSNCNAINEGLNIGKKLAKKLKIRNENNLIVYNRQNSGKIDQRLISELSYNNKNIFYKKFNNNDYTNYDFHISIDGSESMAYQNKFENSLKLAVAFAQISKLISGFNVVISIRSTSLNKCPYICILFDSKTDSISKIKNLFCSLKPNGLTPEGLCFDSIFKLLPRKDINKNVVFVNICDGEPYFKNKSIIYVGESAAKHTNSVMKKFKSNGIKILSYFIMSKCINDYNIKYKLHRIMYENNSHVCNLNFFNDILKSLNEILLKK